MARSLDTLAASLRRPENVSVLVAIAIAIPASFLSAALGRWVLFAYLLIGVGMLVPTAYRKYWDGHRSIVGAAVWTVVASLVGGAALLLGTLVLDTDGGLSETTAAAVAFLVTGLGGLLTVRVLGRTVDA